MSTKAGVLLVAVGLGLAALAGPVLAHADFVSSDPAPCSSVASSSASPSSITIEFSEEIDTSGLTLVVSGDGDEITSEARLDLGDLDRTRILVEPAQPLEPGAYRVRWDIRSAADGDVESGGFGFGVDQEAPENCSLQIDGGVADEPDGSSLPVAVIVGLSVASILVGAALVKLVLARK